MQFFEFFVGSFGLLRHLLEGRKSQPGASIGALVASFKTRGWSSMQEYRHMSANNAALLVLCALMIWLMGPLLFIAFFLVGSASVYHDHGRMRARRVRVRRERDVVKGLDHRGPAARN